MQRWHYFVGDIHGCYREYMALEAKILRHAKRHQVKPMIVSVGDMVDRGPDSAKVVSHFRKGVDAGTHAAVLGNHESFLLSSLWAHIPWADSLDGFPVHIRTLTERYDLRLGSARTLCWEDYRTFSRCMWITQGGFETLQSYDCDPYEPMDWTLDPQDLQFLAELPVYWENDKFVVTHAMADASDLKSVRTLHHWIEGSRNRMWAERMSRYKDACYRLLWRRALPERAPDNKRVHISGHTSFARVKRNRRLRLMQIDTGCVYDGRLTAWCGEDDHLFRVSPMSEDE